MTPKEYHESHNIVHLDFKLESGKKFCWHFCAKSLKNQRVYFGANLWQTLTSSETKAVHLCATSEVKIEARSEILVKFCTSYQFASIRHRRVEQPKKHTGWPKSKFEMSFGYLSETMHFWPHVGKAKMHLRGVQFFGFSADCLQFSAVCLQFFKKNVRLLKAFWLYQHGVKNA